MNDDIAGGWNGPICVRCSISYKPYKSGWSGNDETTCGNKSVVIFCGESLCYNHFIKAREGR